ncbi:AraC family transcriptional regulator [Pseudodesulfovibrio indicus]|uniref:AraC family transcriptional regulator n=1 Tax=Pseudodesulfovibrio indicus TaxID=1716143 RepID=UPI0029316E69|nr:AraC family transcriptional regulator [Pseudodesulfovibrio indicus]
MRKTTKNLYLERINTVLLHIQSHLDDELALDGLARLTGFSPTHFHRIFKGMMGETVADHIRRIRLERAALRLAGGRRTVTDTAFDAGYETVESFSRSFKRMFGCPPSKYRERHWEAMYDRFPGLIHYRPDGARTPFPLDNQKETNMEVRMEDVEAMRVAFVRNTGPYNQCDEAWSKLCAWAGPKGLLSPDARYLGVAHDDPQVTPSDKIRYDACVTVDKTVEGEGEVGIQTVGGGRYAVTLHKGPYENLETTYAELMGRWLPQSGEQIGGNLCFELYLNDPQSTPPEELLTDLYISLK